MIFSHLCTVEMFFLLRRRRRRGGGGDDDLHLALAVRHSSWDFLELLGIIKREGRKVRILFLAAAAVRPIVINPTQKQ